MFTIILSDGVANNEYDMAVTIKEKNTEPYIPVLDQNNEFVFNE